MNTKFLAFFMREDIYRKYTGWRSSSGLDKDEEGECQRSLAKR
ncbi:MAG TPA: hypothetical protein PK069_07580 [Methanolinea sp.]|nr:hypothetical protein [Methanolinea sp.]HQK56187.1 hypothetical protein [Methanolinea sp.]